MAPGLTLIVEGVIAQLRRADSEGVLVSKIFDYITPAPLLDEKTKDAIWEAILKKDDVVVYQHDSVLNKSPLSKLGYTDAIELGLGDRKLVFRLQNEIFAQILPPEDSLANSSKPGIDAKCHTAEDGAVEEPPKAESAPTLEDEEPQSSTVLLGSSEGIPTSSSPKYAPAVLPDSILVTNGSPLNTITLATPKVISKFPDPPVSTSPSTSTKGRRPQTFSNQASRDNGRGVSQEPSNSIKRAIFTSYETLSYGDGKSGIFINPPGSKRQFPRLRGRPPLSMISVFRSDKLKDPRWLEQHKGTWIQPVAAAVALNSVITKDLPAKKKGRPRKRKLSVSDQVENGSEFIHTSIGEINQNKKQKLSTSSQVEIGSEFTTTPVGEMNRNESIAEDESRVIRAGTPVPIQINAPDFHNQALAEEFDWIRAVEVSNDKSSTNRANDSTPRGFTPNMTQSIPLNLPNQESVSILEVGLHKAQNLSKDTAIFSEIQKQGASEITSSQTNITEPARRNSTQPLGDSISNLNKSSTNLEQPDSFVDPSISSTLGYRTILPSHSKQERRSPPSQPNTHHSSLYDTQQESTPNSILSTLGISDILKRQETEFRIGSYRSPFQTTGANISYNPYVSSSPYSFSTSTSYLNSNSTSLVGNSSRLQSYDPELTHESSNQRNMLQNSAYSNETEPLGQSHKPPNDEQAQIEIFSQSPSNPSSNLQSKPNQDNEKLRNLSNQSRISPPIVQSISSPIQISSHEPPRGYFHSDISQNRSPLTTDQSTPIADSYSKSRLPKTPSNKRKLSQIDLTNGAENDIQVRPRKQKKQKFSTSVHDTTVKTTVIDDGHEFQTALDGAGAIQTYGVARLSCMHQNEVGNLILSEDTTILEFISSKQCPPEVPLFTIHVSEISQYPTSSVVGSRPMELRIRTKPQNSSEEQLHCFAFSGLSQGVEAANSIKAKIAAALVTFQVRPAETKTQYKCDKCEKIFKNKNGLEYHVTKSLTTCNPTHDPTTRPKYLRTKPRESKVHTKKQQDVIDDTSTYTPRTSPKPDENYEKDQYHEESKEIAPGVDDHPEDGSDSSTSSEDSVIDWFKKHATNGPVKRGSYRAPERSSLSVQRTPMTYQTNPRETSLVREILKEYMAKPIDKVADKPQVRSNAATSSKILIDTFTSDIWDEEAYENLLMSIITKNNNIFPGDRSLWIACLSIWLKGKEDIGHDVTYDDPPVFEVCCKALENLVGGKKLERHNFTIEDGNLLATEHFFIIPGLEIDTLRIKMLKELIKASYPRFYVPSQFAPSQVILDKLQEVPRLNFVNAVAESDDQAENTESLDLEDMVDVYSDEDIFDEAQESAESESDGSEESDGSASRDQNEINKKKRLRVRDTQHNGKIAQGVQKFWDAVRDNGGNIHPYSGETMFRPMNMKPKPQRLQEKKEKRALNALLSKTTWSSQFSHTSSFMPNSETGAWDQKVQNFQVSRLVSNRRGQQIKRIHTRKQPSWAEPITFLQEENGAWSVRPFGHGVKPIYSRPARIAHGNPFLSNYLATIQSSYRPILYPTKRGFFLPSAVSKQFLASGKSMRDEAVRISPRTGLPVRKWVKRNSNLPRAQPERRNYENQDEEDEEGQTPRQSARTRRSYRKHNKDEDEEDQDPLQWLGTRKRYREHNSEEDGESQDYQMSEDSETSRRPRRSVRWPRSADGMMGNYEDTNPNQSNDQTTFTTELSSHNSEYEDNSLEQDAHTKSPARSKKLVRSYPHRESERLENSKRFDYARHHTHLPSDFNGIYKNAEDIIREFDVQVAPPNEATKRRQRNLTHMTPEDETRFLVAVVVVRTLTGGVDFTVDWVLVSTIFRKFTVNWLQKRWQKLSVRMKPTIDRLANDFQEPFLTAYEKGEIAPINYDNLVGYNWKKLVDWVIENIDTHLGNRSIDIPNSRQELGRLFHYNEIQRDITNRDILFQPMAAVYKRIETASAESNSIAIGHTDLSTKMSEISVAKSWIRVVALTPENDWDLEVAKAKLNDLGLQLVTEALKSLTEDKIVMHRAKGRITQGRSYEATDAFLNALRKTIREPKFIEAVTFKHYLDSEFRKGNTNIRVDYFANEGTVMAITSLQANHRIVLIPTNVPMDKFGLTDGGYETRMIPRGRMRFEMDIVPSETYMYDDDNEILRNALEQGPPRGNEEIIPIWFTITERVNRSIWKKVVTAVGQILALRAGIDVKELARVLKPSLEEWEIRLVLDWGTDLGIWKKLDNTVEGWMADEWWWLALGRWCIERESD